MDFKKRADEIYSPGLTDEANVLRIEQALRETWDAAIEKSAKQCDKAKKWNDTQNCFMTTKSSMMLAIEIRVLKVGEK